MTNQAHLFERLAHTHKPDCVLSLEGPRPQAVPAPDALAATLGSDAIATYASACRPIYEDLRRIIGQVSGLLILAQLTTRRDILDLPELQNCDTRLKQAQERLSLLATPNGTLQHRAQLEAALSFCTAAMKTFSEMRGREALGPAIDLTGKQIKRAYVHLQAASSEKAGLVMVDFSQACCCGHG